MRLSLRHRKFDDANDVRMVFQKESVMPARFRAVAENAIELSARRRPIIVNGTAVVVEIDALPVDVGKGSLGTENDFAGNGRFVATDDYGNRVGCLFAAGGRANMTRRRRQDAQLQ